MLRVADVQVAWCACRDDESRIVAVAFASGVVGMAGMRAGQFGTVGALVGGGPVCFGAPAVTVRAAYSAVAGDDCRADDPPSAGATTNPTPAHGAITLIP